MKSLSLLILSLISSVWGEIYRYDLISAIDVLPPGQGNTTLGDGIFGPLFINSQLGTPGQPNFAALESTTPNVVVIPPYNPSVSSTYVPIGQNGTAFVNDNLFTPRNSTGPLAYESFTIAELTAEGQGFLRQTSGNGSFSAIGFGFNRPGDLGFPNLIQTLYQQAKLDHNLIALALDFNLSTATQGTAYFGGINSTLITQPLVNYTVSINSGDWAFGLTNIKVGASSLGYNGVVTFDTSSPFGLAPMPVFQTLVNLIGGNVTAVIVDNTYFKSVSWSCTSIGYPNSLPNITYSLDGKPLTLTPFQYIAYDPSANVCYLAIVGRKPGNIAPPSYTLGASALNGTLSVFDFDQKTYGVSPLA